MTQYELAVIELLTSMRDRVDALPAAMASAITTAERSRRIGDDSDRARLSALLIAIDSTVGNALFSTNELLRHAQQPLATRLRAAIGDVVGQARSPGRVLGKALAKVEDIDLGGRRVVRVGSDGQGISWSVVRSRSEVQS